MTTTLQEFMSKHGLKDHEVAAKVGLSRVQVSRIRRGITGASIAAAMRLQTLTGRKWWRFLKGDDARSKQSKAA